MSQFQDLLSEFAFAEKLLFVDVLASFDSVGDFRIMPIRVAVVQVVWINTSHLGEHSPVNLLLTLFQGVLLPLAVFEFCLILVQAERLQRPLSSLTFDAVEEVGVRGGYSLDPLFDSSRDAVLSMFLLCDGKSGHIGSPWG